MPHQMTIYECLEELEAVAHEAQQLRAMVDELVSDLRDSLPTVTATPESEIPWRSREVGS
jgi:hypothetical protein